MKTFYKTMVMIAAAAITLSGCSQKETLAPAGQDEQVTLKFNIKNVDEVSTKALLGAEEGNYFLDWENNDKIGTYSIIDESNNNNRPSGVTVNGDKYELNVQTTCTGRVAKIYSYFPYSNGAGTDRTAAIVSIPEIQTINAKGFDADAMPMAGTPVDVNINITQANTDTPCGEINFSNLGSIIQFKVYSSVDTDETLTSVQYVTSGSIGGAFSIDLTGVDSSNEESLKITAAGENYTAITTKHNLKPAIGTGADNAIPVYMVVAPGKYADTKVIVTTNKHTYTLDASGEKEFIRSHVKPLKIDIQKGAQGDLPSEETWEETALANLSASDIFVIVGKVGDKTYAMSNNNGTSSAPSAVEVTVEDGKITSDIASNVKWNISGDATNGYVFYPNGSTDTWLYCTSTNNGVRVGTNNSKTFTVNNGYLYHTSTSRFVGVYQGQDWRCYTSIGDKSNIKEQSFSYYKRVLTVVDTRDNAPISWSENVGEAEITNAEVTYLLPDFNNNEGLNVTFASSDEDVATITAAGAITAKKAGETTISATYSETETSPYKTTVVAYVLTVTDNRTYTITVNQPEVAGCTISANPSGSQKADTEITLSVTATADGYKFSKWVVKDADNSDVAVDESNKFSMPSSNVTVTAEFVEDKGTLTTKLTNANIVEAGNAANSYANYSLSDDNGNSYSAYAIKNQHSKATSNYHYLQIKKSDATTAYYVSVPSLGTKILSITMTVSNTNKPMGDGGNSATLYFSNSNSTSTAGTGVASGTGASSVTIDCSSLSLNSGYITAGAAVRIWDIEITYE